MDNQGRKIVVCDNGTGVKIVFLFQFSFLYEMNLKIYSLSNVASLAAIFPNMYFHH
jgi:hypothetical protein